MTTVKITATGLGEAIATVRGAAERARNLSPVLPVIAQIWTTAIDDRFRSSTDFAGQPFAPNKPSTVKRKGSSKPAIDTSRFRSSISARPVGRSTIAFGTNVKYAAPVALGFKRAGSLRRTSYAGGTKRPKGAAWSVTVPGRNPFPVREGRLIGTGPGLVLLEKTKRTLVAFIANGRTT